MPSTIVSGMPRPPALPRVNTAEAYKGRPVEKAKDQPDYQKALDALAEANAPEIAFLNEHVSDVVVTTSLRPFA